jgi:FKBP-type peptidyl-prolyl cis-trans isomerase (trigger factor)
LVQRRTDALVAEVLREWQERRIRPRDEAEAVAQLRAELQPRAHEQVKISLLLEAIVRQEGLEVSDVEVEARITSLAAEAGTAAERVRAAYQDPDARRQLHTRMLQGRAIDVIAQRARIKPVAPRVHVADAVENG